MKTKSKISAYILRRTMAVLLFSSVIATLCLAINLPEQAPTALFPQNDASFGVSRTLSFAERVAYQTAIEDVYWRHRIWPKTNPGPKPPLDKVMSQAQIEKKVEDYLRNSQTLEDYWRRPISAEQLQAEMERMASNTKQPEVLQELFEALGNDPFVIAECLARPILTERLTAHVLSQDRTGRFESPRSYGLQMPKKVAAIDSIAKAVQVNRPYQLPAIANPSGGCTDDTWTATTIIDAPSARSRHTAVWTGSEMIVWGATDDSTGGRYNPSTDSWIATNTTNAPTARYNYTAVWTGSEMIVWGGSNGSFFNTGGRYNPSTDNWTATSLSNVPAARDHHTAVWTGSEMIVWGGSNGVPDLNTGGRYNPSTDNWTATSTAGAPAGRYRHTAVWNDSGSEMIIWGGYNGTNLNTGGRYNPSTDSWTATSTTNAPSGRLDHPAVWTGSEMIVWGGVREPGDVFLNTGGRYSPDTDSWTATSTTNAPSARVCPAVWTGSEMIVWGGDAFHTFFNTGGRYNPITDSWTATSTTNAPSARTALPAVWTGSEISKMIVWGGLDSNLNNLNTGGRYCAAEPSPTPSPTATATPTATPTATATSTPRPTPVPRARPTPVPRP